MSVALLIITHDGIGQCMLSTASRMLGAFPLNTQVLSVQEDSDPDALVVEGANLLDMLDEGDGILILTDMFGATPSNIAAKLLRNTTRKVTCVSGVNLPMLVRIMNYSQLALDALAQKAYSGGREGVMTCQPH